VGYHLGPDLDRPLPQRRERPALERLRQHQLPQEVGQVVGQGELERDRRADRPDRQGGQVFTRDRVHGLELLHYRFFAPPLGCRYRFGTLATGGTGRPAASSSSRMLA
jgi:hypothetical protein